MHQKIILGRKAYANVTLLTPATAALTPCFNCSRWQTNSETVKLFRGVGLGGCVCVGGEGVWEDDLKRAGGTTARQLRSAL